MKQLTYLLLLALTGALAAAESEDQSTPAFTPYTGVNLRQYHPESLAYRYKEDYPPYTGPATQTWHAYARPTEQLPEMMQSLYNRQAKAAQYSALPWYGKAWENTRSGIGSGLQSFKDWSGQRLEDMRYLNPKYAEQQEWKARREYKDAQDNFWNAMYSRLTPPETPYSWEEQEASRRAYGKAILNKEDALRRSRIGDARMRALGTATPLTLASLAAAAQAYYGQ